MKSLGYLTLFAVGTSCSAIAHAQADTETGDRIVVTGSRIVRDGSQMPTPVTVVTTDNLEEATPSNIADGLNKLPQFNGSTSQTAGQTFNAGSEPLGNFLNLRGLGSGRLLVLMDGYRVAPTSRSNAVDVNILPQMLVERVDIVTGGVSAVYGSDAVSGVVNYVIDDDFVGLKTKASAGISDYGDAFSIRLGAAGGVDLGDSLHFMASYEYYDVNGVNDLYDRPWAPNTLSGIGGGTASDPIIGYPDIRRPTLSEDGSIWGEAVAGAGNDGPLVDLIEMQTGQELPWGVRFTDDGELVPFDPGLLINNSQGIGGDGGIWGVPGNSTSIAGGLETHQAFARLTGDLSPSTQLWVQGSYAESRTNFNSATNNHIAGTRTTTIFANNAYLRQEYSDAMYAAADPMATEDPSFVLRRIFTDIPVVTNDTTNKYMSGQVGIEGEIGNNWRWNAVYNYGRAEQRIVFNEFKMRNFWAALDAVRDPDTGEIVCNITLTNPGFLDDCVPINLLGSGNVTQSAFDFTRGDSISDSVNEMHYVQANVQGELFELPAGPLSFSIGAEYRKQSLEITSNSDPAFFSDENGDNQDLRDAYFGGIRGIPGGAQLFDSINIGIAEGDLNVKEVYGEVLIPILSGTPGAEYLELDLAGRLTDYSTSGTVKTWKVGVIWQPIDDIRVRFNRSRDIAAPTLVDLFAGENVSATGFNDIHLQPPEIQNQPVPLRSVQGNPTLAPEVGDTLTLGVVFQPSAVPGLTLAVDAYNIKIKDAIDNPDVTLLLEQCEASNGTGPTCDNFLRNPNLPWEDRTIDNAVRKYIVSPQNLALLETQGIDFEASYRMPLGPGNLTLRAFVNYLDKYETQQRVDTPTRDSAGLRLLGEDFGLAKWKGLLSQTFSTDRFSITAQQRLTGQYNWAQVRAESADHPDGYQVYDPELIMPNKVYVDLNASYNFDDEGAIVGFINVQNLFNLDPPATYGAVTNLSIQTDKVNYDVLGRYFTAGIRTRF